MVGGDGSDGMMVGQNDSVCLPLCPCHNIPFVRSDHNSEQFWIWVPHFRKIAGIFMLWVLVYTMELSAGLSRLRGSAVLVNGTETVRPQAGPAPPLLRVLSHIVLTCSLRARAAIANNLAFRLAICRLRGAAHRE